MTLAKRSSVPISHHHQKVLDDMRQARAAELEASESAVQRSPEGSAARRAMYERFHQGLGLDVANIEGTLSELNQREIARGDKFRKISRWEWMNKDYPPPPVPPPPPVDNSFWWLQTTPETTRGINSGWDNDDLQFFDQHFHNSNKNIKWHIGAVVDFGILPARLPPSSNARWKSEPSIEVLGYLYAFTGLQFVFSPDDKWTKCNLALGQTIYQAPPNGYATLGEKWERIPLLNEENRFRWHGTQCPTFQAMPRVDFALAFPGQEIFAQLDIRFEIEQEGESVIRFGEPNYDSSFRRVRLRTFQWNVTPA